MSKKKINKSAKTNKVLDAKERIANQSKALFDLLSTQMLNNKYTTDAFANPASRIGFGQPNQMEDTEYPLTRMSYNYNLFISIYRGSWIARKIIDVLPADMLKNWIKLSSDIDPIDVKRIQKTIKNTKTIDRLKEGLQWGRLFGGAAGLILIDGEEDLSQPLDYDTIEKDSYKGLLIFDRWSGIYPSSELVEDINDPEFGLPKYYSIILNNASTSFNWDSGSDTVINKDMFDQNGVKVHYSRILRFNGRNLPFWEKQQEMYWGESEIEIIFEELKKRDNASYNIASLIFLANIRVLKMSDLGQLLSVGSEDSKQELYNVLSAQNEIMNNMSLYVMDKDDDFESHQYSFSGLDEIYQSFMLDVAGAAEMPVTKIFGREPSGFNSTGESDLNQYCDTVEEKQRTFLTPILDKLLPVICLSTLGAIPEDFDWEYNQVQTVSNKDLADLANTYVGSILEVFNAGLIDKAIALKELKQQAEITGMWTNITDDYIQQVEEEGPQVTGEEMDQLQNEIAEGYGGKSDVDSRDPDLTSEKSFNKTNINPHIEKINVSQKDSETWRDRLVKNVRKKIKKNEKKIYKCRI